ncbi:MAG: hypothetical protein MZV64_02595 [Ignavibacteriales bacterium]|nr:hypothetical protein [Ignavibacteriales bacterium]
MTARFRSAHGPGLAGRGSASIPVLQAAEAPCRIPDIASRSASAIRGVTEKLCLDIRRQRAPFPPPARARSASCLSAASDPVRVLAAVSRQPAIPAGRKAPEAGRNCGPEHPRASRFYSQACPGPVPASPSSRPGSGPFPVPSGRLRTDPRP